jgi:hypothetical protein
MLVKFAEIIKYLTPYSTIKPYLYPLKIFNISIIAFLCLTNSLLLAQKKVFNAKITCIQPYCGGARPTPEMEADAARTKPYAKQTIVFISTAGKIDSVKTDADGNLNKKLKVGKYKLFESWRYYKLAPHGEDFLHFNKECLAKEWGVHFMEITITKKAISKNDEGPIYLFCSHTSPCQSEANPIPQPH